MSRKSSYKNRDKNFSNDGFIGTGLCRNGYFGDCHYDNFRVNPFVIDQILF